jgi:hypothetical protein
MESAIDHLNVFHLGVLSQRFHGQTGQDRKSVQVANWFLQIRFR